MPPGTGHDDKDPGSMNLDIGYIKKNNGSWFQKKIYKPYIRNVGVKPGAKVDYELKKYGLVEIDQEDHSTDGKVIAIIHLANITTKDDGKNVFKNDSENHGPINNNGKRENIAGHWTPKHIQSKVAEEGLIEK